MQKNALVHSDAPASGLRPSAGKAVFLLLASLPFTGCNCRNILNGTTASLVASPSPVQFGTQAAGSSKTIAVVITNQGDAPVTITAQPQVSTNTKAFTAIFPDAGTPFQPIFVDVAASTTMLVTYDPPNEENDEDAGITVTVQNDSNVALVDALEGFGSNACFNVVCDAGVPAEPGSSNPGGCFGTCQAGKCVYAGACSDETQCLSNGMCNPSTGACQGTSNCAQAGAGTCSGNVLIGDIPPGDCDQGSGQCLYTTSRETCDCACVQNGLNASCTYSWEPVQGLPSGSVASVWSAGQTAGDLWLSVINGSNPTINPNTVYQQVNGAWNSVGQVANAYSALCSGPGCGLALTGSSDQDVYGVTDCTTVGSGSTPCTVGGAWHYTGTAADENFPTLGSVGPDLPLTTLVDIGGTAFALNTDEQVGPEIVSGTAGTWKIDFATEWKCQSQGAIWGTSATDLFLSWGCSANGNGPGQLAHYNGTTLDSSFALPATEYAEGLWGTSDTDIWAAGTHRWHYNGTTWTEDSVAPPNGNADQTVWGNGSDYFAGGGYIALYHLTQAAGAITADWTEECIAPGYGDPSVYSFTSDGTNFYATTSSADGGLAQRCPNGTCQ
jgi:hypothetical protein